MMRAPEGAPWPDGTDPEQHQRAVACPSKEPAPAPAEAPDPAQAKQPKPAVYHAPGSARRRHTAAREEHAVRPPAIAC